jgi:hypothetical protein
MATVSYATRMALRTVVLSTRLRDPTVLQTWNHPGQRPAGEADPTDLTRLERLAPSTPTGSGGLDAW